MRKYTIGLLLSLLLAACGVNDPLGVATPQLIDMVPAPGAADVAVATSIQATFDAPVDLDWVESSFALTDALGATTVVAVSDDANTHTVTLTPSTPLAYDTVYEAAFTAGIGMQSSVGTLAEDVAWTFSTEAAPAGDDTSDDAGGEAEGDTLGEAEGDAGGDTGGDEGGDTGEETGGDADGDEGATGNTGAGDPVTDCDADACTFENVTLSGASVPANATWTLVNVTIDGAFEIGAGAVVHATNLLVNGKLEATGASDLIFAESRVTGKVELKHGGTVHLTTTVIGAHLELIGNDGAVYAAANDIHTYLRVDDNTGGVELVDNVAGGDLFCFDNDPAPTGSGNSAGGTVWEQCVAL